MILFGHSLQQHDLSMPKGFGQRNSVHQGLRGYLTHVNKALKHSNIADTITTDGYLPSAGTHTANFGNGKNIPSIIYLTLRPISILYL